MPVLTEADIQQMVIQNSQSSPEDVRQHAESMARWMRGEAAKGNLSGQYHIAHIEFKKKTNGSESIDASNILKWPHDKACEIKTELGKHLPIDRLQLKCDSTSSKSMCSIYMDM